MSRLIRNLFLLFVIIFYLLPVWANHHVNTINKQIVEQYAPLVYLHQEEQFNPSSVDYFLNYMNITNNNLVTKDNIDCPSCTNLNFFKGQSVNASGVPIYTSIVPKPNIGSDITDVFYWMFYPYNRGKRVCISPIYINGNCWGKYSTFGHHVGDWEHVAIRFKGVQPVQIYLSQHDKGAAYTWGDSSLQYVSDSSNTALNHPVVYSAQGSHGLYNKAADHVYRKIFNGDKLVDKTSKGKAWQSWNNIKMINSLNKFENNIKSFNFSWNNYSGRWGNRKDGCHFLGIDIEKILGVCILNSGPLGPNLKSYTNPHQLCINDEFIEHLSEEDRKRICNK